MVLFNKIFNVKSKVIIDNFGTLFNYELVYDCLVRRKMKYEILAKNILVPIMSSVDCLLISMAFSCDTVV